ncbi:MAG: PKD domain-containing protein [Bacteroidota bacterium]
MRNLLPTPHIRLLVLFLIAGAVGPQMVKGQLVTTVAGTAETPGSTDGHAINQALLNNPHGIAADKFGRVYIADRWNHKIRVLDTNTDSVYTLAGDGNIGADNGQGANARFYEPWGLACDSVGTVYVADTKNQLIRKIDTLGNVTTLAGTGNYGVQNGPALSARFANPTGITVTPDGTVYVCDHVAHTIRRISTAGVVTTLAGTAFLTGDTDGSGSGALFNRPYGIQLDHNGDIIVADEWNHKIRRVTPAGLVSTIAGVGLIGSDDGPASSARFNYPWDVAVDTSGTIYVMDGFNHTMRRIDNGTVDTYVGSVAETGAEDGYGLNASFSGATALCYDIRSNSIYVGDAFNDLIRRVVPSTGLDLFASGLQSGDTICQGEALILTAAPDLYVSYQFFLNGSSVQSGPSPTYATIVNQLGEMTFEATAVHLDGYQVSTGPFTLQVVSAPSAGFESDLIAETPSGFEIQFTSTGANATSYRWNFGDPGSGGSNFSFLENPTHLYEFPGTYDVELIVNNSGNCPDTLLRNNAVSFLGLAPSPIPVAALDTICTGDSLRFDATLTIYEEYLFYLNGNLVQGGTQAFWDQTFAQSGGQLVELVAIDDQGDSIPARELTFFVADRPQAAFTFDLSSPPGGGVLVNFSYTGTSASAVSWNFGDPASGSDNESSSLAPEHLYQAPGSYWIELIASGIGGCEDTLRREIPVIDIGLTSIPALDPAGTDTFCVGEELRFSIAPVAFASYQFWLNGELVQDSTVAELVLPLPSEGPFILTSAGTLDNGEVIQNAPQRWEVATSPDADFEYQILGSGPDGTVVQYFPLSLDPTISFFWEFGDTLSGVENTSLASTPTHTYRQPGFYDVRLTVTNEAGCSAMEFKEDGLILLDLLSENVNRGDTICEGEEYRFFANTDAFNLYEFWVDGIMLQRSASSEFAFQFTNAGTVTLQIWGETFDGNRVSAPDFSLVVVPIPLADFAVLDESLGLDGYQVSFQSNVPGAVAYQWDFGDPLAGDDNVSQEVNPIHLYQTYGNYSVRLIANTGGSCADTLVRVNLITYEAVSPNVFVPTAFTPNGDGINDILYVRGRLLRQVDFSIFNEWGQRIFQSQSQDLGWDGTHLGQQVEPDTYVYVLRVTLADGQIQTFQGQTTLIR